MRFLLSAIDRLLAPAPDPARVSWLGEWTYAHRGLHSTGVPENSRAAYEGAVSAGLGIECDIQRSSDGRPMLFHDWELERLTGRMGRTADFTGAELAGFELLGGDAQTIPPLAELCRIVAGGVPVMIEIKSRPTYDVVTSCKAVNEVMAGYDGLWAVMSFDPRVAAWFRRHAPDVVRGLVMEEIAEGLTPSELRRHLALWHARPDFLAYDINALPSSFAAAQRARGIPVPSWTVKTAELAKRAALHADAPIAEAGGLV